MESKIILSLSMLKSKTTHYVFKAPNGAEYNGVQTNEAPVKFLLAQNRKIEQILCLATPTAQSTENGALAHFTKEIQTVAPHIQIQVINIPDNGSIPDTAMANLLQYLNQGDQVYLDTSGGNRYTVMGVMQLVRLLEYKGVKLEKAVYANLSGTKRSTLDDVTELYRTQELLNGMQELATFGSVRTLKNYFYKNESEDGKRLKKLLNAIGSLTDAITLCRRETMERAMASYQIEMAAAAEIRSPIMRELVGLFQEKFGTQVTIPWVLRWCLEHRMLFQALTVYREWMPGYLLRDSGLFVNVPARLDERFAGARKKYRDDDVALWEQFLHLAQPEYTDRPEDTYVVKTLLHLNRYLPESGFGVTDVQKLTQAAWDMLYAKVLRNMILHGNEKAEVNPHLLQALEDQGYATNFISLTASDYIKYLTRAINRFV